ncbi:MAG: hypothetical protein JW715_14850 [Sedimentisphaerales bacterium]|nr:hypothetical protein [Sedimentisphaerales bacterium]
MSQIEKAIGTTSLCLFYLACSTLSFAHFKTTPISPVTIKENDTIFIISNGIVTAQISKQSGSMISLIYKGTETVSGGYWSHDTREAIETITRVTIDPKSNNGMRGEISIKAISGGKKLGFGPGAEKDGDFPADIDIRYSMGKSECGIYTYCIFEHLPDYPAQSMTEARYCAGLTKIFDWITVDEKRNKYYPEPIPEEDKYVYIANQWENRAYGFSSTTKNLGWWMINPSVEYLSGGPTKVEFLCHRHTDKNAAPVVLNYWRSSHYGGASVTVTDGEYWTKVIGPFFMYINTGSDPNAMWKDAKEQAKQESNKWPYAWVAGCDYPSHNERSTISGKIILKDPLMPGGSRFVGKLMIGLAPPPYLAPSIFGGTREITWQLNAKHYQFWVQVDDPSGCFCIPNVRPGTYSLYAFADGVLGEFVKNSITVESGGTSVDLGQLEWIPVRCGQQLWDIGIANRTATEFMNGDKYFKPGIQLEYPKLFPDEVNFIIGKSDFSKDWYFQHIPHNIDGNANVVPYRGVVGEGIANPYTITFELAEVPRGTATLRLAICGTGTKQVEVAVNGTPVGPLKLGYRDSVITLHQIHGIWYERELSFDASLMKQGKNVLTLTVPAGPINNGVIYDYIRLELNESQNMK